MIGDVLAPTHLLLILIVALVVLGPKRLPEVGKTLGKGIRDFREAMSSYSPEGLLNDDPPPAPTPTVPPAQAATATAPPPPQPEPVAEPEAPADTQANTATATSNAATAKIDDDETQSMEPAAEATEVLRPTAPVAAAAEPEPVDAEVVEKPAR